MIDYKAKEICLRSALFKGFLKCTIVYNGNYSLCPIVYNGSYSLCSIVLNDSSLLYVTSSTYMIELETLGKYNLKGT